MPPTYGADGCVLCDGNQYWQQTAMSALVDPKVQQKNTYVGQPLLMVGTLPSNQSAFTSEVSPSLKGNGYTGIQCCVMIVINPLHPFKDELNNFNAIIALRKKPSTNKNY